MKQKFITDPAETSDSLINSGVADVYSNVSPSALDHGESFANLPLLIPPAPAPASEGTMLAGEPSGPNDGITAVTPDGDLTDQMPGVLPDAATAADGGGATAASSLSESIWVPEPTTSAGPAGEAIAAQISAASLGYGGAIEAPAHTGDLMSTAALNPAAPLDIAASPSAAVSVNPAITEYAPIVLASLANPAPDLSLRSPMPVSGPVAPLRARCSRRWTRAV